MKQAIVIRTDLKMDTGKIAAQSAHASLESYKKANKVLKKLWEIRGQKKVVLKVNSEKELLNLFSCCKREKISCALIRDAGKTQIEKGTITALGIGPETDSKIDKVTGSLKLL